VPTEAEYLGKQCKAFFQASKGTKAYVKTIQGHPDSAYSSAKRQLTNNNMAAKSVCPNPFVHGKGFSEKGGRT
jgi:hypothetical protein